MVNKLKLILSAVCLCLSFAATAAEKVSDYYVLDNVPLPKGETIEVGSVEWIPDGRLAVATRHGEIWMLHDSLKATDKAPWKRYAHGLHEVLGLAYNDKDNKLYATQRPEITAIADRDADGIADSFRTYCAAWGINGNYHEYGFGTKFDKDGNMWVVLCLTGSGKADPKTPYRGWAMRIAPGGKAEPICSGIRSPGSIGLDDQGRAFYGDNQGLWNGTSCVKHLKPYSFQGNPTGNIWYDRVDKKRFGEAPEPKTGTRIVQAADTIPTFVPPIAQLPHGVLGNSTSGIICDTTKGKFGPFGGQLFILDQNHSNVVRLYVEEVNGVLQTAAFRFMEQKEGFGSGNLCGVFAPDGSLFVGGTNRGWGSRGKATGALDRVRWTGKTPFETLTMKAKPDGFEFSFTEPIDPASAKSLDQWKMTAHTYKYQHSYGSPVVDKSEPKVTGVTVIDDNTVRISVDGLVRGHIHYVSLAGIRSKSGKALLHPEAWYTLNEIPK